MGILDDFASKLTVPLGMQGLTPAEISARVAHNLRNPIGSDMNLVNQVFGNKQEWFERYKNFQDMFDLFLEEEMDSPLISASRKLELKMAKGSPSINLGLIKNVQNRRQLEAIKQNVFPMDAVLNQFGSPRNTSSVI